MENNLLTVELPLTENIKVKDCSLVQYGQQFLIPQVMETKIKKMRGLVPALQGMFRYQFDYDCGSVTLTNMAVVLSVDTTADTLHLMDVTQLTEEQRVQYTAQIEAYLKTRFIAK